MNRVFLAVLIVIFGLGVTSFIRLSASLNSNVISEGLESQNDLGVLADALSIEGKISLSTLAKHNKLSDCWVAYDGKVYDVTSFLPKHPGSAGAISPHCGTYEEFTNAFEGQHSKSKVSNLMRVGTLMGDFEIQGVI